MRYNIIDRTRLANAIQYINNLPTDGQYVVEIMPLEKARTGAQNRTAHGWLDYLRKHLGNSMEEMKYVIKDRLDFAFKPDQRRMNRVVSWFLSTLQKEVRRNEGKLDKNTVLFLFEFIEKIRPKMLELPIAVKSSKDFTKEEFTAYMDEIKFVANENGVILPMPDPLTNLKGS